MLSTPGPPTDLPVEPGHSDGLSSVVEGIYAYLLEIDAYRAVCRRHEGTATVDEQEGSLRVTRRFQNRGETTAHLTAAVRLLALRQRCRGRRGNGRGRRGCSVARDNNLDICSLVRRNIIWEGRPLRIGVREQGSRTVLHVDLCVYPPASDQSELPLRAVATALRCHEFLVPDTVALPLPGPGEGQERGSIREYLARAMPANLYASKWI